VEHLLRDIVDRQKRGIPAGIASVCSAHPWVLEAAAREAASTDSPLLIESTSSQVNQYGGYTGMKPPDFAALVERVVRAVGLPGDRLAIGADHLGPFPWRSQPAARAMENARLLARDCVRARYTKLHLDASMPLADDPVGEGEPLPVELAARRTAELCEAAEDSLRDLRSSGFSAVPPVYVVGTEVPAPGGTVKEGAAPEVTPPSDLRRTLDVIRRSFLERGLAGAWERVCAVVVQPGVEFGDGTVFRYDRGKARGLAEEIRRQPGLVFEGHSTDYQLERDLANMVEDGIAILKVGPALSFAMREGLFLLSRVEEELLADRAVRRDQRLPEVLERVMRAKPEHWRRYYRGSEREVSFLLRYSLSDRARYYWADPEISLCVDGLVHRLGSAAIPLPLISQYFPAQLPRVEEGGLAPEPRALVVDRVRDALKHYSRAIVKAGKAG
jgi:D-tagatose-1,6-bisphosphate aldolase subunit GatZ/KbaZ